MPGRDDLFDVPPDEFIAARNALVKELRGAGKADAAPEIAALRKPSPVVWAVNHVARSEPARIEALLDATAQLRHAQGPHGHADKLRDAMKAHRDALSALGEAGARALDSAKLTRTQAVERRVLDTAQGAAIADEKGLRKGTLTQEYEAPGF